MVWKKQLWKFFLHAIEKFTEWCGNGYPKDLVECMVFWEVTINFNFLTIYFLSMVVYLSQPLFSGVNFGNLNVLEQWLSNFLVLGTLYMFKNYCRSPRAFVYVAYIYRYWLWKVKVKVAQSCPTLCDPMNYTVHRILQARILEWVAFPFFRNLPNPGIKPRTPALQADSLPGEPQGKPKNIGMGTISLLQQIFPTQESTRGLLHRRWILHQLSYQGSPVFAIIETKNWEI